MFMIIMIWNDVDFYDNDDEMMLMFMIMLM